MQARSRNRTFSTLSEYRNLTSRNETHDATKVTTRKILGTLSDPSLIHVIKKLRSDFSLKNFVETGTYEGETSFFLSGIFEKVFTCDVHDWPKRNHFYFKDNIEYEILDSPSYLTKNLAEIKDEPCFLLALGSLPRQ